MNIVEFALKFKDLASSELRRFGSQSRQTFSQAQTATDNLNAKNKNLGRSYDELTTKIRVARKETSLLDNQSKNVLAGFGKFAVAAGAAAAVGIAISGINKLLSGSQEAYKAQAAAETRLSAIMKNTMNASDSTVKSILALTSAQQKLGVIGDEVQLSGAQELSTYLTKADSLKKIIPVMNDMLAQQYGLNASQEQAQNIATMLGKVMDGQTGALSRYGYKFDEQQEKILKFGTEAQRTATLVDVVSASVGGVNEALAQTPEGKLKQTANLFGDMQENIGKIMVQAKVAFLPLANMAMNFVNNLLPVIEQFIKPLEQGVQRAVEWMQALKEQTGGLSDFIEIIKKTWVNGIWPAVKSVFGFVSKMVSKLMQFVSQSELLKDIFRFIGWIVEQIGSVIKNVIKALSWIYDNVVMPILNGIEKAYRVAKELGQKLGLWKGNLNDDKKTKGFPSLLEKANSELLSDIAKNTAENADNSAAAAEAVTSGGPKIMNITVQKFLDAINIYSTYVEGSETEIETLFNELFGRVVIQGART